MKNNKTFAEFLYDKKLDPFTIALDLGSEELDKYKEEWGGSNISSTIQVNKDIVFDKLSSLNLKVKNEKLVKVVSKMTKDDSTQTNSVGSWVYYCLTNNKTKAASAKEKVSKKYQDTLEKYLDSFIKMLEN